MSLQELTDITLGRVKGVALEGLKGTRGYHHNYR
jgi:hypothetical protein